jgi:hypothetical protein
VVWLEGYRFIGIEEMLNAVDSLRWRKLLLSWVSTDNFLSSSSLLLPLLPLPPLPPRFFLFFLLFLALVKSPSSFPPFLSPLSLVTLSPSPLLPCHFVPFMIDLFHKVHGRPLAHCSTGQARLQWRNLKPQIAHFFAANDGYFLELLA